MSNCTKLIVLFVFAAIQIGVMWVNAGYRADTVSLPETKLTSFPFVVSGWEGEDTEFDTKVFLVLKAEVTVSRSYRMNSEDAISYHNAAWTDQDHLCPHPPELCYTTVGWGIKKEKTVELKLSTAPPVNARLLTLENEGQRINVLYWYQMGKHVFWNRNGAKIAKRDFWGKKTVPATLKFMLQNRASQGDSDEESLVAFAEEVYAWSRNLQ